jgi:cell division protein ZipA
VDTLRLILILLGLIILAAIVLFHKPQGETRRNHARWLSNRREPHLGSGADSELDSSEQASQRKEPASASNLAAGLASARQRTREQDHSVDANADQGTSPGRGRRPAAPEKIVTLYVQRKEGRRINGPELLDAAIKAGLDFGEMNIFHRLHEGASEPIFSMANLTAPGHFDPGSWNVFDTPGVTFFVTLPAPVSALDAWDAMLATARRMAELLDAEVLDDNRCLVTRQRIAQVRDEMRDYDRRHGMGKPV